MELFWLLLPVAAASGWWAARRAASAPRGIRGRGTEYFTGLNYLIEDQSDQAIEVFTRMADVDPDTAEIHLALGNLFRRRGEVDRALHIHNSLINRPTLTVEQRRRALLELGEDYLRAGLFDRAEELFRELLKQPGHKEIALARLAQIFQQEKDWRQAMDACDRLEDISGVSKRQETAHFCCELAEASPDSAEARSWLRQALERDPQCARANLLLGRLALRMGDYPNAIAAFQAVERQDRDYLPEILAPLSQCYEALGRPQEWGAYLREIQQRDHSGRVSEALASWLLQHQGAATALRFLEEELRDYPTLLGLRRLVEIKLEHHKGNEYTDLRALHCISTQLLNSAARYRCTNCGFVVKALHWSCPSCQHWSSIKPMPDLVMKTAA